MVEKGQGQGQNLDPGHLWEEVQGQGQNPDLQDDQGHPCDRDRDRNPDRGPGQIQDHVQGQVQLKGQDLCRYIY